MRTEIINSLYITLIYLAMFGTGEILYHFFHVKAEMTRKFSHLSAGIIAFLFPLLITNHLFVLMLAVGFIGLLYLTKQTNLLKSVHSVKRKTFGSYIYPVSIYGCFLVYSHYDNLLFYYLPLLILAISDTLAAIGGKAWAFGRFFKHRDSKTLFGSTLFFVSALIISIVILSLLTQVPFRIIIILAIIISLLSSFIEAISSKGLDNITIPLTVMSILIFYQDMLTVL